MARMSREEAIIATREHFADLARRCIAEAEDGTTPVNDLDSYRAWREEAITSGLAGEHDHTLTFQQYRHYLETGDCIALLP